MLRIKEGGKFRFTNRVIRKGVELYYTFLLDRPLGFANDPRASTSNIDDSEDWSEGYLN